MIWTKDLPGDLEVTDITFPAHFTEKYRTFTYFRDSHSVRN